MAKGLGDISDDDLAAEIKRRRRRGKARVLVIEGDHAEKLIRSLSGGDDDDDDDDEDDDDDDEGEGRPKGKRRPPKPAPRQGFLDRLMS